MNAYLSGGNILDAITKVKQDLDDTQINQMNFLNKLMEREDGVGEAISTSLPFCLDNKQFNLREEGSKFIVSLCNNDNTDVIELPKDGGEGTILNNYTGLTFNNVMDLEDKIQEGCDSTQLLNRLMACSEDIDDTQSLSNVFSAQNQLWVSKSSANVKNLYNKVLSTLANTDDGQIGALGIINTIYSETKEAVTHADSNTGEYVFTEDTYKVQSFVGSFAMDLIGAAISLIGTAVAAACNVVIGVVVTVVGALITGIGKLISAAADTHVKEKNANNNLYAQPVFQVRVNRTNLLQTIGIKSDGDGNTVASCLSKYGCCTIRVPGWLVIVYDNGDLTYSCEFFISIDMGARASDWFSYSRVGNTGINKDYPFYRKFAYEYNLTYGTHTWYDGDINDAFTHNPTQTRNYFQSFYMANFSANSGSAYFVDAWSYIDDDITDNELAIKVDKMVRANIVTSLFYITLAMTYAAYGVTGTDTITLTTSQTSVPAKGAPAIDWAGYFWRIMITSHNNSSDEARYFDGGCEWSTIVNKIIPRIRGTWTASGSYSSRPIEGLAYLIDWCVNRYNGNRDYISISGSVPKTIKPRFCPPSIDTAGLIRTGAIMLGIVAAGVVVAVVAKKISNRKKLKLAAADAQEYAAKEALGNDPKNKQLQKNYLKAKKRLDRRTASYEGSTICDQLTEQASTNSGMSRLISNNAPALMSANNESIEAMLQKIILLINANDIIDED